jgi:hypothetical protein
MAGGMGIELGRQKASGIRHKEKGAWAVQIGIVHPSYLWSRYSICSHEYVLVANDEKIPLGTRIQTFAGVRDTCDVEPLEL